MGKVTAFHKWFPVLPFLLYWLVSFIAYEFGPFIYPTLSICTYVYFFAMLAGFIIAYGFGLIAMSVSVAKRTTVNNPLPLKILDVASLFAFIGTLLFVVDRFASGAGSFDLVLNEMSKIRDEYAANTTWITTIAVLPQSLRLTAFAAYFYCLMNHASIKRKTHVMIFGILLLDTINMILTASRGILFWNITYLLFYLLFCKRMPVFKTIFSFKYKMAKTLFVLAILISISYFYFVARNRTIESTLEYLGEKSAASWKYPSVIGRFDYATIGASEQLFSYLTHGFQYVDVFLKNAEVIHFDPLSAMGLRVTNQLKRLFPDYEPRAVTVGIKWENTEGLNTTGWPSIFGWPLAMFGVLGSMCFFLLLGFTCGIIVSNYFITNNFGWFVLTFVVFTSLNGSFDWILRDFEQYVAITLAMTLIYINKITIMKQSSYCMPPRGTIYHLNGSI
jgi:hypothetical protein